MGIPSVVLKAAATVDSMAVPMASTLAAATVDSMAVMSEYLMAFLLVVNWANLRGV